MDGPLWDPDEMDAGERRSLAPMQQQFLLTGDAGEDSPSPMEERIGPKAKKLPDRVQQLIDDISLLYYHGYLEEYEDEIWKGLLSISNRSQVVRESPIARTAYQRSDPELDLGFEVGSIIRFIHDEQVPAELVWGFIIGLVGESDRDWEREAQNLVELFGELEDYYETRLVSAGTEAHEDDGFQEERNEIREILREQGFAPAPPLVTAVLQEYTRHGIDDETLAHLENMQMSSSTDPTPIEQQEYTRDQIVDETSVELDYTDLSSSTDPNPTEHPDPPSESPTSEDARRTGFESIVSKLANQTRLRSIDRLAQDLIEDVFHIQSRELWSVDFDSIVCSLGENGKTHVENFDEIKATRHSRTHVLRRLSYKDSSEVNRPVTREDPEAEWSLTPYGELLYKTRIEQNCSTNWIYNLVVNPERLDDDTASIISRVIEGGSEP
ncbi:hypothetical protein [Halobellus ordinarius]|uniref:hypothetical protein n=1 Tax=Halobellus ordinarius TaxID=3075120 RepID=UPI00288050D3|nr:hypothetical protein [Halobellus sp. ZY16]